MREEINEKLNQYVVDNMKQALGCSDPCVIAYCAALAREALKAETVERVEVRSSCGLIKNASKVSIPNADGCGVGYSAALGVYLTPERKLKIFTDVTDETIKDAKKIMEHMDVKSDESKQKLYIRVNVFGEGHSASCTIEKEYLGIKEILSDDEVVFQAPEDDTNSLLDTTLAEIYEYADTCPVKYLEPMKEAIEFNENLIGENTKPIPNTFSGKTEWMARVVSAIQARMEGVNHPVIMNCGSGNQGIFSTISVSQYAKELGVDEERMLRACLLSNLTVIYIKKKFGSMSALCSGAVSACGVSAGLVYLEEKDMVKCHYAIQNLLSASGGIICDGAKVSCALKLQTFLQAAVESSQIALKAGDEFALGGFIDEDVEQTVISFAQLGKDSLIFDRYMCDILM